MHPAVTARRFLARRPWVYWVAVAALTALVVVLVRSQMSAIEAERASWGSTRAVLVADHPLAPGDPITASRVDVPVAMVPAGALSDLPADARLRQRVAEGEMLVDVDLAANAGPAGRADPGTVVVAVRDPLASSLTTGLRVQLAADGILIAQQATVVDVADDVVYVAVDPADAAVVAAASRSDLASLLYLP